jgi:hypothetical protein
MRRPFLRIEPKIAVKFQVVRGVLKRLIRSKTDS